jgi:hypothetical protein
VLPAIFFRVRHQYALGGYEIVPNVGLDLDEHGLEWVRTYNLRHKDGLEFRVIDLEDMRDVLHVGPHPTEDELLAYYGRPPCV